MSTRSFATAAAMIALCSCKPQLDPEPATQILLRIDCGGEVCERAQHVEVRVDKLSRSLSPSAPRVLKLSVSNTQTWPLDVPIVPRDPRELPDAFQVTVAASDSEQGMLLADARAISFFLRASQRVLHMRLDRCGDRALGSCESEVGCLGMRCLTCVAGSCEPTPISDPYSLPRLDVATLDQAPSRPRRLPASDYDGGVIDAEVTAGATTVLRTPSADGGVSSDAGGSADAESGNAGASGKSSAESRSAASASAGAASAGKTAPAPLTWSEPSELEQLAEDVVMPGFARNSAGDLAVAWWQDDSDGYLWVQRFHHGAWNDGPLSLAGPQRPSAIWSAPSLAVDGAGRAHVLALVESSSAAGSARRMEWIRWNGGEDYQLEAPWQQGRAPLNGVPTMLSATDDGRAVAMFAGPLLGATGAAPLFASTFDQGVWAEPVAVGNLQYAQAAFPDNAANGAGDYVSAFGVLGASDQGVRELKLLVGHLGDAPNEARVVLPEPLLDGLDVAIDDAGAATALFTLGDAPSTHVASMRFSNATRAWSPPARISDQPSRAGDLTLLATGQPVAVWGEESESTVSTMTTMTTMTTQLVISSYTEARGWSATSALGEPFAAHESDAVRLAASARGDLVIAWTQMVELSPGRLGRSLFARHATTTGTFSERTQITLSDGTIELVGLAWDDTDHVVIVWRETEGGSMRHDLKWSRSR